MPCSGVPVFCALLALVAVLVCPLPLPRDACALDATFLPERGIVTPKTSGSVPVGTIVAWPVSTDPDDMENWLDCDGSVVSAATYPRLVAVLSGSESATSATVPNLQGLFLRGYGRQSFTQENGTTVGSSTTLHLSGNLGEVQGDAIRNIQGTLAIGDASGSAVNNMLDGAFGWTTPASAPGLGSTDTGNVQTFFSASRVVPTDRENRPVNMAVRYLIRAY